MPSWIQQRVITGVMCQSSTENFQISEAGFIPTIFHRFASTLTAARYYHFTRQGEAVLIFTGKEDRTGNEKPYSRLRCCFAVPETQRVIQCIFPQVKIYFIVVEYVYKTGYKFSWGKTLFWTLILQNPALFTENRIVEVLPCILNNNFIACTLSSSKVK